MEERKGWRPREGPLAISCLGAWVGTQRQQGTPPGPTQVAGTRRGTGTGPGDAGAVLPLHILLLLHPSFRELWLLDLGLSIS